MPPHSDADDPSSLDRFLPAQEVAYDVALVELRRGRKQSHWMWFIFPQLRGLGQSRMSWFYGIADEAEARAYLAHAELGPRLIACSEAVLAHADVAADEIVAPVDAMKLRSSATLFAAVSDRRSVFHRVIDAFFDGQPCRATLDRLAPGHRNLSGP